MGKTKDHFYRMLAMKNRVECPDKRRLEALDWRYKKSSRYSSSGKPEAALTCRHFGMHRSLFYH
jgi:hypothetical protein